MPLLNYLYEEGSKIEPEFYVPIIPMCLVNGAEGIATGYSTNIPQYNPRDIIEGLIKRMEGHRFKKLSPWYKGWTGEFREKPNEQGYTVHGNAYIKEND